jgi:argininosuccinate lyase
MAIAAPTGFSLATEIADYLAKKNVPFAQAHEAAGKCVALCESSDRQLHQLTDAEFLAVHPELDGGVRGVLTVHGALNSRTTSGGTAPLLVGQQIKDALNENTKTPTVIASKQKAFSEMMSA